MEARRRLRHAAAQGEARLLSAAHGPVGVVADAACCLPADLAASEKVVVVPIRSSGAPGNVLATSAPNPDDFGRAVRRADSGAGVVVVTLAREMSSTHDSAQAAAASSEGIEVRVVDTRSAAGGEGLVALAAAGAARAGADLAGVEAAARLAAGSVRLVAAVADMAALGRSGRVPTALAWGGGRAGVRPVFELRDGTAVARRPAMSAAGAEDRIVAAWESTRQGRAPSHRLHVTAMHSMDAAAAGRILHRVSSRVEPASAWIGAFPPEMAVHTGAGMVGLAWRWEELPVG